jgi:cobalamin synthase
MSNPRIFLFGVVALILYALLDYVWIASLASNHPLIAVFFTGTIAVACAVAAWMRGRG